MNSRIFVLIFSFYLFFNFQFLNGQLHGNNLQNNSRNKTKDIVYFNPEIVPAVDEIRAVTNDSFFSAVTSRFSTLRNSRVLRVETPVAYNNTDIETILQIIENNDADFAVVPKVKFFKVGLGNYVFSSQVVVSMKLYDSDGRLIAENSYDTFRKNARIFGSAENSIKIGTEGALKNIIKALRRQKLQEDDNSGF